MNTHLKITALAAAVAVLPNLLYAQPTAHYVPGVEGIKGATLPPPGIYFRDYNYFYTADQVNDSSGNKVGPADLDALTYANIPRLIWITDKTLLGGYIGVDGLLPLVYQQASANTPNGHFSGNDFGIGDFYAEGTISWHLQKWDFSGAVGLWMPTGDSTDHPGPTTRPGLGYWDPMLTAGATYYIDDQKTWAISALNRYEFPTEQRHTDITPGQAYTLEWGISKSVTPTLDLGAIGYYQQKVTTDDGPNASKSRDRVAAAGPEVAMAFPQQMFFVSLRYAYEFMAEDRAQGHTITLTLTKRF